MSKPLPIYEVFETFQGEGIHMGKPAFFVRTYGCPIHCPWCDSAGTWHPNFVPEHISRSTFDEIADMAHRSRAEIVVITGGEPAIHDLSELVRRLHNDRKRVHLETSGAYPIQENGDRFDWVTVSPKLAGITLALETTIGRANEIKLIIDTPTAGDEWLDWLDARRPSAVSNDVPIWLHPEWSQRSNPDVLEAICRLVLEGPERRLNIRAGYQLHKLFAVDQLDERSRPNIPLGGDIGRGF